MDRQLGPIQRPLDREPDITIRFVEQLASASPLRYIGLEDAGFTDDSFLILRAKHKSRARVQLPFERIGGKCEIVCERGILSVPLLVPILNLTALTRGCLPLHASAFEYNGQGVLSTGWSKGGKTEMLLTFMAHGARYVGDEWVYILPDGGMCGIPEPIRVWEWHLRELPQYWERIGRAKKARLRALRIMSSSVERANAWRVNGQRKSSVMRRLAPLLKRQLHVDVTPHQLFGADRSRGVVAMHRVFFVVSGESDDIRVDAIDGGDVADRMVFSLEHERLDFMAFYWKFRFAFPERRNEVLEQTERMQRELLHRAFDGKECFVVHHPYPVSLDGLFERVSPMCTGIQSNV